MDGSRGEVTSGDMAGKEQRGSLGLTPPVQENRPEIRIEGEFVLRGIVFTVLTQPWTTGQLAARPSCQPAQASPQESNQSVGCSHCRMDSTDERLRRAGSFTQRPTRVRLGSVRLCGQMDEPI